MNLPNKLTIGRICAIPFFMLAIELESLPGNYLIAFAIFALASLTDLIDGKIARKYNLITDFGKLMDPLADKLLVTAALIYFIPLGLAPAWLVVLILSREFLVTSIRLLAAGKGIVLAADKLGKYKTATTMIWICYALVMLGIFGFEGMMANLLVLGIHYFLMGLSLAFTLTSGINYILKNRNLIA